MKLSDVFFIILLLFVVITLYFNVQWLLPEPRYIDNPAYIKCRENNIAVDADIENCETLLTEED